MVMKRKVFKDKFKQTDAVLCGKKTQFRVLVSQRILDKVADYQDEYWLAALEGISVEDAIYNMTHGERMAKAPYYVGEEVAIAQSYETMANEGGDILGNMLQDETTFKPQYYGAGWRNKMCARADLMPHRIKITNLCIERLQDISEDDCIKEGIQKVNFDTFVVGGIYVYDEGYEDGHYVFETAKEAFATLANEMYGEGTWKSNPYVFVYDFELVK